LLELNRDVPLPLYGDDWMSMPFGDDIFEFNCCWIGDRPICCCCCIEFLYSKGKFI